MTDERLIELQAAKKACEEAQSNHAAIASLLEQIKNGTAPFASKAWLRIAGDGFFERMMEAIKAQVEKELATAQEAIDEAQAHFDSL